MKILITGGAGFIGSHLARRFVEQQHEVHIIDNFSSGRRENLAALAGKIELVEGDIRDSTLLSTLSRGVDLIYHQAAVVSVPYSVEHPQETHDVNIQGTLNVLLAARHNEVKRVVFACSSAVYGDDPASPKHEAMAPQPLCPYGVEKITGEYYLNVFHKLYGVETVSLRYFNVFGPRQDPRSPYSGVISIFVDHALKGLTPKIYGDGEQSRDFVYVENIVQANLLAGTSPAAAGRCYNVGCGVATTLNALLRMLSNITHQEIRPEHLDPRPGDIRDSLADISRIKDELGYAPTVDMERGLRELVTYEKSAAKDPLGNKLSN